jgi:hypothetical protein
MRSNEKMRQFVKDGGVVFRADTRWWRRAMATLCGNRWCDDDGHRVEMVMRETGSGTDDVMCISNAKVEVCELTGDRRYSACVVDFPHSSREVSGFGLSRVGFGIGAMGRSSP